MFRLFSRVSAGTSSDLSSPGIEHTCMSVALAHIILSAPLSTGVAKHR